MMTKDNSNAKADLAAVMQAASREKMVMKNTFNIEKLTREYFYPDVFQENIANVEMPSFEELVFLGDDNAAEIRTWFRHEEGKLRKLRSNICNELATMSKATPDTMYEELASVHNAQMQPSGCDWHGMGYAKIPEDLEDEIFENGDMRVYEKISEQRAKKVFTCRFGKYVADWCKQNPYPCKSCQCFQMHSDFVRPLVTGKVVVHGDETVAHPKAEGSVQKCQNYSVCRENQPFLDKPCVFAHCTQAMIDDCKEYLQKQLDDLQSRLDFVGKYLQRTVIACKCQVHKPRFGNAYAPLMHDGDYVVEIGLDGEVTQGIFAYSRDDPQKGRIAVLNMTDGRTLKIQPRSGHGILYMAEKDFEFLVENPGFQKVWLQMTPTYVAPGIIKALKKASKSK